MTNLVSANFNSIATSIYRLFRHSVGDHAFGEVSWNGKDQAFTLVVIVAFTIICTLVMTK